VGAYLGSPLNWIECSVVGGCPLVSCVSTVSTYTTVSCVATLPVAFSGKYKNAQSIATYQMDSF
jgi:hypothetical protein